MPELPEVETVRRMLAAHLPGRRIAAEFLASRPCRDGRVGAEFARTMAV